MQRSLRKWLLLFLSFYSNVTVSRKPAFLTQCKDFQRYWQWYIYLFTCLFYAPYPPLHKRGEPIFFTAESLWILAWWQVINNYICFVYYTCTFALQLLKIILQWEYHLGSTWKALPKDHCVLPLRACYIKKKLLSKWGELIMYFDFSGIKRIFNNAFLPPMTRKPCLWDRKDTSSYCTLMANLNSIRSLLFTKQRGIQGFHGLNLIQFGGLL